MNCYEKNLKESIHFCKSFFFKPVPVLLIGKKEKQTWLFVFE